MIIDGEQPLFTDAQRDFFYVWDAVEKDPSCFGMCLTTPRRWGKGEVSIIIAYLRTILNQFSHCGIQSKNLDGAKDLYSKLVQRWQRMPAYLKPIDEGESNPKSALRFFEPGKRSTKAQKKEYTTALNSWIDYAATVKTAYDGQKDRHGVYRGVEFCVFSGSKLKSNNDSYMKRTQDMQNRGLLRICEDLDKNQYYELLNDTRVLFNCALQDWVSNTVSEADALGCNVLYPAYRSFPETFANDHERLYVPWSIDDAMNKLDKLLLVQHQNVGKISDHTDGTIDRICNIIEGRGQHLLRMSTDYRKHTRESKY